MRKSWIIFAKKTWLCYIRGKLKNMKKLHLRVLWLSLSIVLLSGCNIDFHSEKTHVGANTSLAGSSEIGTWQNNANIATGKVILNSSGEVLQYKFRDQYDAVFLPDSNGSMIVKKWEKFGLISQSGSVILEVSYQKVQYEQNGCYLFDDGFVLPDGSIIRLADHPKLQLFQTESLKDNVQIMIKDYIWEKIIFDHNSRSAFIYDLKEKKIWLPPIYSSLQKIDNDIILAIKDDTIRMFKTDKTILYELTWYVGAYKYHNNSNIFHSWSMIMQDDKGLYWLISRDGTWIMPPTYELLWNSSSGTIMTIKLEDERYNIIEMDINGKMLQIQNMSPEEWFTKSKYPNMHGDFSVTEHEKLKNKKTWEIFDNHDSIRTNMNGSHIALKKWDKWWIYGFDDYRYDNILFWIATHGGGFMLSDGLAIASREHTISRRWNKTVLLNANSNKEIFTFDDDDEGIFDLYGEARWFFQINRDMIAVRDGKIWKIINKDGQNISDWFSELSLIQDREMIRNMSSFEYSMRQYLLAKKENKSILLVVENEITREHALTLPAWSAKWNNGVISLYDVSENQTFDDQKCFRNPEEGTAKCLQEIQKMKEKKPSLLGYVYPDGYEKSIVLK